MTEPVQPSVVRPQRGDGPGRHQPQADAGARVVPGRRVDVVASVVLLGVLAVATVVASAFGVSLGAIGDACFEGGCTMLRIETGWIAAAVLPWGAFAATTASTIVLLHQRREAWWVPLVGGPAVVLAFGFGWMLWSSGLAA